ncbi:MAG: helix-turn-helix domain-containing protein [Candidatus Omnitrophica bacterium]|nr:helix-turn-helix domain-containing protein [Candidatus Omnitrophota bacterium]
MADEKLLTVRDVSLILNISEKEVTDLAEDGKIPAYKVGGLYMRFKKEQVEEFRRKIKPLQLKTEVAPQKYSLGEKIGDFLYFNDFYLLATFIIVALLFVIFRG